MTRLLLAVLLLCSSARAAFFDQYDAEIQDWQQRCLTNSGTVSGAEYNMATEFMLFVKSRDVRRYIGRANFYLGGNTNALMCPQIRSYPGGIILGEADTLVGWVATNYTTTGGKCNGSSQYINTGVGASSLCTQSDIHLASYSRTSIYEVGGTIGSADTVSYVNYFLFGWVDNNCYFYFDDSSAQVGGADPTPPTGLYLATRTSQTSRVIYKNGTSLLSSGADLGAGPGINSTAIYVHGLNVNNSLNSPTHRELCFYAIGKGVPASVQGVYYKAVQRMQVVRGRAIFP